MRTARPPQAVLPIGPAPGPADEAASFPPEIPGPRPMFLAGWRGNVLQCARDPLRYMTGLHQKYGDLAALVRGGNRNLLSAVPHCPGTVAVFGPRLNEEVLGQPDVFHMGLVTGLEGTPVQRLGAGMFNTNGATHKQLRRGMAPAFQKKWTDGYHRDLVDLTLQTLNEWRPGQRRDVLADMDRLIFRAACKSFCGLDGSGAIDALGGLIRQWLRMAYTPSVRLLPVDLPFTPFRRFMHVSRRLDQALAGHLRRQRAGASGEHLFASLARFGDGGDGLLTESQCIGQALTLLIGAHDAAAAALSWTFFLLAQHPQVMNDLIDEVKGRLRGEPPTWEQLGQMPLLASVVKESMRILPPVPFAGRVTTRPAVVGPYRLPTGTEVLYSQYVTHRFPEIYPRPARFLPGRWARLNPSPYEYLPFGAGPRRCVGAALGFGQIQTVLAMTLQRFRLQLVPRARVDRLVRLTLRPKRGMPMLVCEQGVRFGRSRVAVRGNVCEMVDLS
jgi:cytochrome P450